MKVSRGVDWRWYNAPGPNNFPWKKSVRLRLTFLFDGGSADSLGWKSETRIALVRHENGSLCLGRRLRALGLRFPRQCSLSDFFDLPAATGFGYQKKSSPTMCKCCCAEPDHTGFPTLPLHFVELDLLWGDHQEIRRVDTLVRDAESDCLIRPILDRTRLFLGLQVFRILLLPRRTVTQGPMSRFRHNV